MRLCADHRQTFLQPKRDRAILETAFRFTVARIIKAQAAPPFSRGKAVERQRLRGHHVGFETTQPNKPGLCPLGWLGRAVAKSQAAMAYILKSDGEIDLCRINRHLRFRSARG